VPPTGRGISLLAIQLFVWIEADRIRHHDEGDPRHLTTLYRKLREIDKTASS
jgi:hypothetical protein